MEVGQFIDQGLSWKRIEEQFDVVSVPTIMANIVAIPHESSQRCMVEEIAEMSVL